MKTITLVKSTLLLTAMGLSTASQAANFTEIAAPAGLDVNSRSAGWADYNNDGCLDVMLVNGNTPTLYKNNCDSTFTEVTTEAGIDSPNFPWSVAWADFDGDGDLDAYISGASGTDTNAMWQNNGDGTFQNVAADVGLTATLGTAGASWADYDQDGDLDLFLAGRFDATSNLDGLFRNDDGQFTDVAATAGVQGASNRLTFMGVWFDYDMDGDQDLYLSCDFDPDVLYQNNADGTFTDVSATAGIGAPEHGMGISTGDLNNDGCPDVVSSNNNRTDVDDGELDEHGPSIIYLNNCDGTFTVASYDSGIKDRGYVNWGVNFIDYDNDGDLDFSEVAGGMLSSGEPNAFYENDGTGHLFDITDAAGVANNGLAFGSSWADIDNDGDLDWLVSNAAEETLPNVLYRNDSATGHYLRVKLNGADKNTDAIGAVVKITSGSRTQMRTIQAGLSYGNSEELVAHFGTGIKDVVDTVTINWPTGGSTVLTDVSVDQTLVVDEITQPEPIPATIRGLITEPSGLPSALAIVDVRDVATNQIIAVTRTDPNGNYIITGLQPGTYKVLTVKAGFLFNQVNNVVVQESDVLTINLQLRVLPL